jgi:integrase
MAPWRSGACYRSRWCREAVQLTRVVHYWSCLDVIQWRTARDELGVPEVTTHSFRKTVATLIDDEGLSARIGADHLGHAQVSMTQDRYMARGRVHAEVAELLDRTVAINDE